MEAPASTVSTHTSVGVQRGSVAGTVRQVSIVIGYSDVNIVPFRLLIGQVSFLVCWKFSCFPGCRSPPDVVFALDASGSVGKENFMRIMQFAQDMVIGLPIEAGARVSDVIHTIGSWADPLWSGWFTCVYLCFRWPWRCLGLGSGSSLISTITTRSSASWTRSPCRTSQGAAPTQRQLSAPWGSRSSPRIGYVSPTEGM